MSVIIGNRASIAGWLIAIIIVGTMGVIAFTGPYHHINKPVAAATLPAVTVKIVTDPVTTGKYEPHTINVHVGQPVTFVNNSDAIHTATANNASFNSGDIATAGGSWTFRPSKPGTYKYYCIYHPLMHGVLVVQ